MRWQYLQHVPFEGPAYLASWAEAKGAQLVGTRLWVGDSFPDLDHFDGLFILGGPMNVHEQEEHPWLKPEKQFIADSIAAGKTIVGVCLGAQLLAIALGGSVTENPRKEIGWLPVDLTPPGRKNPLFGRLPQRFMAFHWHGDRFSVPPGAIHVARSEACEEQGFVYEDRIVGLQFHLESTDESIASLIEHCGYEITCAPSIQDPPTIEHYAGHLTETRALMDTLLDGLTAGL